MAIMHVEQVERDVWVTEPQLVRSEVWACISRCFQGSPAFWGARAAISMSREKALFIVSHMDLPEH